VDADGNTLLDVFTQVATKKLLEWVKKSLAENSWTRFRVLFKGIVLWDWIGPCIVLMDMDICCVDSQIFYWCLTVSIF
jgi:hypothetical protein